MNLHKGLILSLVLGFASISFAQSYEVTEISPKGTRVKVKNTGTLKAGETVVFKDSFAEVCQGEVVSAEGESAVIDIGDCSNKDSVKVNSVFKKGETGQGIQKKQPSTLEDRPTYTRKSQGPTEDEDWYTLWSLGFGSVNYNDEDLNDAFDDADSVSGVTRGQTNFDFLGFYWPTDDRRAMRGFIINSFSDTLSNDSNDSVSIVQTGYFFSYHRFFGANIGDGWFLRGDVGLARFTVFADTLNYDFSESSDFGLGLLGGGGYAFAIGSETRMLVGGYVRTQSADDSRATAFSILAGFLF